MAPRPTARRTAAHSTAGGTDAPDPGDADPGPPVGPPHPAPSGHTVREREKLRARVGRIRGQVDGIERLLASGADCSPVLQQLAACRGALNGLMAEILEDHIRHHVVAPEAVPGSAQAEAAEQLVDLVRSYLK